MNKDQISTLGGAGAGAMLLSTVHWEAVPYGECVKIALAVIITIAGYFMHKEGPDVR